MNTTSNELPNRSKLRVITSLHLTQLVDSNTSRSLEDMDTIPIVLAADNNYAMQLAVVIHSILESFKGGYKLIIYVIDGGIKDFNKCRILKFLNSEWSEFEVKWLEISDKLCLKKLKISGHISISTYFRLLIPDLLPPHYEKVIYLDSDLLVNHDISKLWDINIGSYYLLAAQDTGIPYISSPNGLANYRELGISSKSKYFNAGVLVINIKKWKTENVGQKVIEYIEKNYDLVNWWDQDGLNAVLAGYWGELDPRWNQTPAIHKYSSWQESPFSEEVYSSIINDPYIIHFAQAGKPWNSLEEHPANPLFFQYVDMTAWKGWRFSIRRRLWQRITREIKQVRRKLQLNIVK